MNLKNIFTKLARLINPMVPVGGLEISDSFLRFLILKEGAAQSLAVKLPPGAIDDGHIKDEVVFLAALSDLRSKIDLSEAPQNVIVTLAASSIYTQVFSLPNLPQYKVDEAVDLNLRMISPIPIDTAYFDSQYVGVGASGEKEFLGAFAEKSLIDPLLAAIKKAGFLSVAVEFAALSVARVLKEAGTSYDFNKPFLLINFLSHGVDFTVIRGGELYFRFFSSFEGALLKREIDFASFEFLMKREVARVLNFYISRKANAIEDSIVMAPQMQKEIRGILESSFGLKVYDFEISRYKELPMPFTAALGAGLRGMMGRSADIFISLAPLGTEIEFKRERLMHFVVFWRNAALSVFVFLFVIFLITDSILARLETSVGQESQVSVLDEQIKEFDSLRETAVDFNKKLALAINAKAKSMPRSEILNDIKKAAGSSISLKRVYIQFDQGNGLIVGGATSELSAINFKNTIANNTKFSAVSLPFANITAEPDGKVSFQLTFTVKG